MKFAGFVSARNLAIGSCAMRGRLNRLLAALRWPSGVACAIATIVMLASSIWRAGLDIRAGRTQVTFTAESGGVNLKSYELSVDPPTPAFIGWGVMPWKESDSRFAGWWKFGFKGVRTGGITILTFPAWCLVLPLGAFSLAGFRAKRRLVSQAGTCRKCRYPLASAAVCPECGTAAAIPPTR